MLKNVIATSCHALDNLATPLAASIGDLLALVILAIVANEGAIIIGTLWSTFIFIGLLFFIGINVFFTLRNAYVQELVWGGWVPLLLALAVSRCVSLLRGNVQAGRINFILVR